VTAEAQVSAVASFNDSRCAGQMSFAVAQVTLPSGVGVQVTSANMTELVGATSLPDGVTVQSHNAIVDGGLVNYTLTLAIERASLLGGNPIICDARTVSPLTDEASCPIATDPGQPESLSQNISANTETSAVVQWGSPAMTGGNGVTISEYRVTVDGGDDPDLTAINSCGLSSQPATTTVFIEARAEILFSDETLNSLPSSVNITVNRFCATDGKLFQSQLDLE
ncbi:hypothetical protein GBAR_LOCUS20823, partial [Geodia barretti]